MCGLVAFLGRPDSKNSSRLLLDQFEKQASRGRSGFGLVEISKTGFNIKRSMSEPRAILDIALSNAKILLFHHRFPTSTKNLHNQTHPILVSNKELDNDWLVMHNGVIGNDDDLKIIHENLGYKYTTEILEEYQYSGIKHSVFNDSEALAIELARYFEGKGAIIGTHGSAAFIAMKVDKISGKTISIIIGRNDGNPLEMEMLDEGILIASDIESEGKIEIAPFKAYELLAKDFQSKANFGKITEIMPLIFAVKPVTITPVGYHSGHQSNSSYSARHTPVKLPLRMDINDKDEMALMGVGLGEDEEMISAKEEAFYKMQDRITDDISEEVTLLFNELIFDDITDEDMDHYIRRVSEIMASTRERASKAREFFDKALDAEVAAHNNAIDEIRDYTTD